MHLFFSVLAEVMTYKEITVLWLSAVYYDCIKLQSIVFLLTFSVNSLLNDIFLGWSKLKAFADDKIN